MKVLKEFGAQIVVFLVIIAAIVVLVFVLGDSDDSQDSASDDQETSQVADEATSGAAGTSQPADGVEAPVNVEEATLTAVNDYDASGTATRSFENGTFMHEVVATMPVPSDDKFYEGWLVSDAGFISTGEFTLEDGTDWSLVFSSDEDLTEYSDIVITEETKANGLDNIPETHVLEGRF